jgi:ATP-binding cassette, subfamily B, bacterial PglK
MIKIITNLLSIIFKFEKKNFFILYLLITINSVLELLSIGIFLPLANFIFKQENTLLLSLKSNYSENLILSVMIMTILLIFLFKFIFFIFVILFKNKVLLKFNLFLSDKILNILIKKPIDFHLRNSSSSNLNVVQQADYITENISVLIYIFIDLLALLLISSFLLIYEPRATLVIFIILISVSFTYYFFSKKKTFELGKIKFERTKETISHLQEIFLGIKEIKIFKLNKKVREKYLEILRKFVKAKQNTELIILLPKNFFEFIIILFLGIFLIVLYGNNYSFELILIKIGIFAFASFKLLPLFNRLNTNLQYLNNRKYSQEKITSLLDHNDKLENIKPTNVKFDDLIFKDVFYSYNHDNNFIIKNLNLKISKGQKIGLYGNSGVGKTTLLNLISGFILPTSGESLINNINIKDKNINLLNNISYVSQNVFLFNETIEYNIVLENDPKKINYELLNKIISITGMHKIFDDTKDIKFKLIELGSNLSGGQKQRIGIARALYKNSEILLLDEPTNALDSKSETDLLKRLFDFYKDKTIILISHREEILDTCDKVLTFSNDKIEFKK